MNIFKDGFDVYEDQKRKIIQFSCFILLLLLFVQEKQYIYIYIQIRQSISNNQSPKVPLRGYRIFFLSRFRRYLIIYYRGLLFFIVHLFQIKRSVFPLVISRRDAFCGRIPQKAIPPPNRHDDVHIFSPLLLYIYI